MNYSRRNFLRVSGIGIAASQASSLMAAHKTSENMVAKSPLLFQLGIASYTFRNFSLEETIAMTKRLEISNLALKSMHMPLNFSSKQIEEAAGKVRENGIELYGAGVIYMKTVDEVDVAFNYARSAGLKTIIGVPSHDLLVYCSEKVESYSINLAIHNHGPGDDQYPSPESIYTRIKDLHPGIGLCVDIGHTQRIGQDPIRETGKYMDRVIDIHVKDVDRSEAEGDTIEIGRGVINIQGFLEMLIKKRYSGKVSFEFEKDGEDPLPGLAESVGYVRGVLNALT